MGGFFNAVSAMGSGKKKGVTPSSQTPKAIETDGEIEGNAKSPTAIFGYIPEFMEANGLRVVKKFSGDLVRFCRDNKIEKAVMTDAEFCRIASQHKQLPKSSGYACRIIPYECELPVLVIPNEGNWDTNGLKARMYNLWEEFGEYEITDELRVDTRAKIIHLLKTEAEIISLLKELQDKIVPIAFDYETTGIKPHRKGHAIKSVSFAFRNEEGRIECFAFEYKKVFRDDLVKVLTEKDMVAHNAQFEQSWSEFILNMEFPTPYWDTCLAEHCIDNNSLTGLKFLAFCYFGQLYSPPDEMKANKDEEATYGSNSFNSWKNVSLSDEDLKYNALDSYFTLLLFEKQIPKLDKFQLKGYYFFLEAQRAVCNLSKNGICINMDRYRESLSRLTKREEEILNAIYNPTFVKQYPGFTHNDVRSLKSYISNKYKIKIIETIDEKELHKYNDPVLEKIIELRGVLKMKDTYLAQFGREAVDGILHPNFLLNRVVTFRTSSTAPNFQNLPKRDEEMNKEIRALLYPRKGHIFVEWDYKAVEVTIAASYHLDPVMIAYLENPKSDLHKDTASDIFGIPSEEVSKKERYIAKNGFVFPIFYGASAKSMAPNIWELCGPDEKKRFRAMGVKTVTDLQEHIKEMENKFWNVRFKKYGQWRRKTYNEFLAKGYLKVNTGFYCYAPCEFTQLVNRAIQGSACHCLLFSLLNAEPRIRKATNGRSFLVGQIHDSIIGDIHPDDLETVNAIVKECGIAKVKKKWEFITTPLEIEYACTPVDGSLSELKEIGKLV